MLYLAIALVTRRIGLHVATLVVYFLFYGVLALLNHTPYDINIRSEVGLMRREVASTLEAGVQSRLGVAYFV